DCFASLAMTRKRSERTARLFEKLSLFWRRDSSEYAVAMRKATKSIDNRPVSFRPFLQLRIAEARHQCHGARLRLAIFCMPERQIQKHPLVLGQGGVKSSGDTSFRHRERPWIGGECARRAAEHVARHLVEHDHRSKRGPRISQEGIGQEAFVCARHEAFM